MNEDKIRLIVRAEEAMRTHLRGKTWAQKVESIARMNAADKIAKAAMREALAREAGVGGKSG